MISTRKIQNCLAKREFLSMLNDFPKKIVPVFGQVTHMRTRADSLKRFFFFLSSFFFFSPTGQWPCWAFKQHKKKTHEYKNEGRKACYLSRDPHRRTLCPAPARPCRCWLQPQSLVYALRVYIGRRVFCKPSAPEVSLSLPIQLLCAP